MALGFTFSFLVIIIAWAVRIAIAVLLICTLVKYLNSNKITPEQKIIRCSLGEALKAHRQNCGMTQEYVAESLGISRQAVSKWENGTSEPSTSNLIALARLYGISVETLLQDVSPN